MSTNEDATQTLSLTTAQIELIREGLGLLEATLSREEADQIEQIHAIFAQLGTQDGERADGQQADGGSAR